MSTVGAVVTTAAPYVTRAVGPGKNLHQTSLSLLNETRARFYMKVVLTFNSRSKRTRVALERKGNLAKFQKLTVVLQKRDFQLELLDQTRTS